VACRECPWLALHEVACQPTQIGIQTAEKLVFRLGGARSPLIQKLGNLSNLLRHGYAAGLFTALVFSINAQTSTASAEVPFDFRMGQSIMPAGRYVIQASGALLTVREVSGTRKSAVKLTLPASRASVSSQPKLEFHRYGSDYFLAAVWSQDSHEGRALPTTKLEKELISHAQLVQTASISLH
jgi:hypothetical protein